MSYSYICLRTFGDMAIVIFYHEQEIKTITVPDFTGGDAIRPRENVPSLQPCIINPFSMPWAVCRFLSSAYWTDLVLTLA